MVWANSIWRESSALPGKKLCMWHFFYIIFKSRAVLFFLRSGFSHRLLFADSELLIFPAAPVNVSAPSVKSVWTPLSASAARRIVPEERSISPGPRWVRSTRHCMEWGGLRASPTQFVSADWTGWFYKEGRGGVTPHFLAEGGALWIHLTAARQENVHRRVGLGGPCFCSEGHDNTEWNDKVGSPVQAATANFKLTGIICFFLYYSWDLRRDAASFFFSGNGGAQSD